MKNEWLATTLGKLITVKHGWAFKGECFATEGDEIVLTPGNFPIGGGLKIRPGKDHYYTGNYPSEFLLEPGDLLVVMTDLTQNAPILGSPAFVPSHPRMLHNQRLGLVKVKPGVDLDRRFLYYLLLSDRSRAQLRATATGTTVRHTAPERIYRVSVTVPPRPVQDVIGSILGSIDDLIENNLRRAKVLEEMVQAIYREWFLHFRYPGHQNSRQIDSPIGKIPHDWSVTTASEGLFINPRVKLDRLLLHPFVTMGDLNERSMIVIPSDQRSGNSGAKFVNGDTLFARITPCLENGKTGFVQCLDDAQVGRGSTEFVVLRGRCVGAVFTYCLARSEDFRRHAIASMSGASGRQRVRNECFDAYKLAVPQPDLADRFEVDAKPLFDAAYQLTLQAKQLSSLRDMLLPRLLAGQVDLSTVDLGGLVED